ncbi:hypothetical protein [Nonomuraea pusilla]|uniref:hypothetical protein n=1 Tax=Nonomuraea pusilla TaxID=46177 RepID=UPI001160CA6B|nr:hypothetical protein [Nonomuraea pusilla]
MSVSPRPARSRVTAGLRNALTTQPAARAAARAARAAACLALVLAAGSAPVAVPALPAAVQNLWSGQTGVARGRASVVVGHGTAPDLLDDLARRADLAAGRVAAVLRQPVRALVIVPQDAAEAGRLAGLAGAAGLDGLAAVADRGRVIVVPGTFARLTPTGRDVVLAHELTHAAAGTGGLPPWLYEGFADYVGYRDAGLAAPVAAAELAAEVRAGRPPRGLPGPHDFAPGGGDPARLARAYQEAWLACRFIASSYGEETLVRLYREARAHGVDRALASAGLTAGSLAAGWRGYVLDELG